MLEPLFKVTATGAVQVWKIETDTINGRYRMISGKQGGKMTASEWTQAKPKNAGRANATTAQQQCMLEAQAAWEKKQRDGYSLDLKVPHATYEFQCMLAKDYSDEKRKGEALLAATRGQLFSQTKLDGVRLLASQGSMMSRKNRPIVAVPHVQRALEALWLDLPAGIILDGELYAHHLKDDFDELVSLVRKGKPTNEDFKNSEVLSYHVYDCFVPSSPELTYVQRYELLMMALEGVPHVERVPFGVARDEKEIDAWYGEYLRQGYEGQMLRFDAPYESKRSSKLLKRKEFQDEEFPVLDICEGEGNRSGQAGYAVLAVALGNDETFKASIKGDLAARLDLLNNKNRYIGGEVTVRFNGKTPSGVPRFPRAVSWWPEGRSL